MAASCILHCLPTELNPPCVEWHCHCHWQPYIHCSMVLLICTRLFAYIPVCRYVGGASTLAFSSPTAGCNVQWSNCTDASRCCTTLRRARYWVTLVSLGASLVYRLCKTLLCPRCSEAVRHSLVQAYMAHSRWLSAHSQENHSNTQPYCTN